MPKKPTPAEVMGIASIPPPIDDPAIINMLPKSLLFIIKFLFACKGKKGFGLIRESITFLFVKNLDKV